MSERSRGAWRWAPAALALAMVVHNCGYLWIVKQPQFVSRAEPTESLIRFARHIPGPVYVHNFRYSPLIADVALKVALNKQAIPLDAFAQHGAPDVFCDGKDAVVVSAGQ